MKWKMYEIIKQNMKKRFREKLYGEVTQHQRDFLMDAAEESADQICAELGMDPDYELTGSYIRELISTATEECKNSENHGMEKRIRGTMGE